MMDIFHVEHGGKHGGQHRHKDIFHMLEPHEFYLSPKVAELLTTLVTQGKANQVMTMNYLTTQGEHCGTKYVLIIGGGGSHMVDDVQDDPMFALSALGFIVHNAKDRQIFLTQAGIEWVNYHQQPRIARAGYRFWRSVRGLAGPLVAGVAAALTILQALQILGLL